MKRVLRPVALLLSAGIVALPLFVLAQQMQTTTVVPRLLAKPPLQLLREPAGRRQSASRMAA
jgi:hypothetical protein